MDDQILSCFNIIYSLEKIHMFFLFRPFKYNIMIYTTPDLNISNKKIVLDLNISKC